MKNIFLILNIFILTAISCNAQSTISLEEAAVYPEQPDGRMLPLNTIYVKDINNSLNKYTGNWKGSLNGKIYEFSFIKKENVGGYDVNWDFIVGRFRITNSFGVIFYDSTTELDDDKTKFWGKNFQPDLKAYVMYFVGNSIGCAEAGDVYLIIQPATPNQMSIIMIPDNDTTEEGDCPSNFQPTIPYKKTINLTKQ
ncbi:hypothetical protein JI747_017680 [Chryseobacterium sp. RG1]|uniref:DUF6705 domain-containing protein n=1 Tax=Chryseobacterium tagetis TaxID=2801334 RepID=A0ABS8A7U0_9FLAO|nr:DUF6705 family protein [Chryseobacterium tagetis]MCA6069000.1 hypothetical protein [Chryseobacterium tagetis]